MHDGLCGYEFPGSLSDRVDVSDMTAKLCQHDKDVVSQKKIVQSSVSFASTVSWPLILPSHLHHVIGMI